MGNRRANRYDSPSTLAAMDWNQLLRRLPLDGIIRHFLFPLSAVFAIAALVLSIRTLSDLQQSSISSAQATVQSVEDSYRLKAEYPEAAVLSAADRHNERYWVVSTDGIVLATSDAVAVGTPLDPAIWEMRNTSRDGTILTDYSTGDMSYLVAGALASTGDYWSIVQLEPPFAFTTTISLILAILALSLMSATGLIALQFVKKDGLFTRDEHIVKTISDEQENLSGRDLSTWQVGGDGGPVLINADGRKSFMNLHEAVLKATDDFVIVLDQERNLVYSNPVIQLSETEELSKIDGLTAFSDRYLDDKARTRFEDWLTSEPESRRLIMDVRSSDGFTHPTRWTAQTLETSAGSVFEVFVGHSLVIEEFPDVTF